MSWNEPGGRKPRDPWGGGGGDQRPPDIDELIRQLRDRLSGLFGGKPGGGGKGSKAPLAIAAVALGIFYVFWAGFTVDQQERAVVLSFGKYDRTLEPGLNWHLPPVEEYFKVNVGQTRSYQLREEMLTEDTNIVGVSLEVQYQVLDPQVFLLKVSEAEAILHHSTESALRQVVGSSTMDDVLVNKREEIAASVEQLLQDYLDNYNTGIQIVDFVLTNTQAPEPVRDAFNDVAKAKEDEDRFMKEAEAYANGVIPEARGRAQRLREEAMGYKERLIASAEGDASRFTDLLTEYRKAPQVTRDRLYIETIETVLANSNKVVVDVEQGNNMMYLPLDQIIKNRRTSDADSGSLSPSSVTSGSTATSSGSQSSYGSRSGGLR